ncbi:MAG: ABC transporter permease [Actinomycetota bacterium]|nr:ABC transporter permease [Actinomycetota bacterium]
MSPWTQIWLIARREFAERGRSKPFVVTMAILTVAILAIGPVSNLVLQDRDEPIAVGLVGFEPSGIEDELIAQGALLGIEIDVVRFPPGDPYPPYLDQGVADAVLVDGSEIVFHDDVSSSLAALIQRSVDLTVKRSALDEMGLSQGEIAAVQAPVLVTVSTVKPSGDPQDDAKQVAAFLGAMVLYVSIIMFGQFVAMGTVEEKQNRVVEVVLSRVRPWQVLVGKVAGIGLLGLAQLVVFAGAGFVTMQFVDLPGLDIGAIGIPIIANVFFWFILGYAFYAFLYAAVGSTVSRMEDLQGAIMLPIALILPGYFLSLAAAENPDRAIVVIGSMIPMWAPFVMPVRLATGGVAPWEIAVAIVGTALGAVGLVWIGSRVYRGALLRIGGKVKLKDAWRAASE